MSADLEPLTVTSQNLQCLFFFFLISVHGIPCSKACKAKFLHLNPEQDD